MDGRRRIQLGSETGCCRLGARAQTRTRAHHIQVENRSSEVEACGGRWPGEGGVVNSSSW